ncbi:hypothetical protein VP1G_05495 [Cytospora mali]|uniref:Uncharacterized protein n=1 Tax=Cytospora mali TaxID=578113 RepID=A0A194V2T1_CYTMA|nr:hypothetical protein VP1G_05495 [Valsa mali var. pyri (nom. inval.)]
MLTHLPSLGGGGGGGGGSSSSSRSDSRTRGDMNGITSTSTSRNTVSASTLTTRGTRPAAFQDPAFTAGGETSLPQPSGSTLISVSPRSASSPAYCISLVSTATQANDPDLLHSPTTTTTITTITTSSSSSSSFSQRACRELACPPAAGPSVSGYTGSVTQPSFVQPYHAPPGGAAATGLQPSHRTAAGAVGSAHATTTTSATSTDTAPAAAAAVLDTTAMCTSGGGPPLPSASSVRMLLNTVAPQMVMEDGVRLVPLPSTHHQPQRVFELRAAAFGDHGRGMHDMLVLILAPPSMLRLLRSEQWIIKSEAVVVKWIRGVLLSGETPIQCGRRRSKSEVDLSYTDVCGSCGTKRQYCQVKIQDELFLKDVDLLKLLPALIDHSQTNKELGSAYNILSHLNGLSLSSLPRGLTLSERQHIDFQTGRFVRRLSLLHSPTGKFGPAISVLCPAAVTQSQAGGSMGKPGGMDRWSLAFHAILEGILRDAEDMAVTISYQTIRRHFRRLRSYLDAVTVPRLVILDATHDSNIMAERKAPTRNGRNEAMIDLTSLVADSDDEDGRGNEQDDVWYSADIRVTGLRDWSNCTFGDPLMCMVFSEDPSREFLHGFSGRGQESKTHKDIETQDMFTLCGDIVEYPKEAHVRLLLYQCYHATVAVVKEFYRPQSDSTNRELAARKRLHAALAKLEDIEDDPKRRHARPFGEMSPAKKPKTVGDEEDEYDDNEESLS